MARGKGFQTIVGLKKGSTWGTAVAAGAGDGIYALSVDTPGNLELVPDLSLTGSVTMKPSLSGNKTVDVTLKTLLTYEGLEVLIALAMGTAGAPSTVDVSARKHALKPAASLDGIFGTLAYEIIKDTTIIEIASVKWMSFTLTGKPGAPCELEAKGIGYNYEPASATNTTTSIDSITLTSNREVAMFAQGVWSMNAQGGAALAGSDAFYVQDWSVTFERSLDRLVTTQFGDKTDEPIQNGFAKVSGSWTFPVLQTGTGGNSGFMADQLANTAKKASLVLTAAALAGSTTQKFSHSLYFPYLQLGQGKPTIGGPGKVDFVQPWEAHHVAAIPTGFPTGYTDALTYEIVSQRTTDPLA